MHRLASVLIALALLGPRVSAQQTVPPAAPTIGPSAGLAAGIAIPVGSLTDTHAAGYALAGMVDFSAADQPYSFRAELTFQHYDHKDLAPPGTNHMNIWSLGGSLLARSA